jgi:hypothetical protein
MRGAPDDGTHRLDGGGTSRAMRGGSWYFTARDVRSAYRDGLGPGLRYDGRMGFSKGQRPFGGGFCLNRHLRNPAMLCGPFERPVQEDLDLIQCR